MQTIRQPAVSGRFYPDDPVKLQAMVKYFLQEASTQDCPVPKALIAPHAGYIYSGAVAGMAYACLHHVRDIIRHVVIIGPAHFVPISGLALSSAASFSTPLGCISVDEVMRQRALQLPQTVIFDAAHEREHSLEVQLPFLQLLFQQFTILPIVVGHCSPEAVKALLRLFSSDPETLIVVSSDLSHYHAYAEAKCLDTATSEAILNLDVTKIPHEGACGALPIQGLLSIAAEQHWKSSLLALCNSGDTAGPKDRVVGYGAYHFYTE
jgi:AmmeMemoRadiSam system protein B